ncbi:MAG: hypothetical protein EZS28_026928, partial [Streblomastix strix]
HLLQALDLCVFGPYKLHLQRLRVNHSHDSQEFIVGLCISAMRQATTPINIRAGFLAGALRETENAAGYMVAQYVPESIKTAILKAKDEGIMAVEAPTRVTNIRAQDPWGFVNYNQFMGIQ